MDDDDDDPIPDDDRSKRVNAWAIVFLLNLPLPLYCASEVCRTLYCLGGVVIGIAVCAMVSFYIVHSYRFMGKLLCYGGACIGLLQFFPVLQLVAGLVSMAIWGAMSGVRGKVTSLGDDPAEQFFGAVLVTIQTGQFLLLAALIAGGILYLMFRTRNV